LASAVKKTSTLALHVWTFWGKCNEGRGVFGLISNINSFSQKSLTAPSKHHEYDTF